MSARLPPMVSMATMAATPNAPNCSSGSERATNTETRTLLRPEIAWSTMTRARRWLTRVVANRSAGHARRDLVVHPGVAGGQAQRALQAVVDVGEAAGLLAVAPDLDAVVAGERGGGHLAADGGRCL